MKHFAIFLPLLVFLPIVSFADDSCYPNHDWPKAPCLDENEPALVEKAKKEWARYADIKSERFLETYKNEMINAIQYDVLEQWLEWGNNSRHKNVYTYFSIYDENFDSYFELPKKDKFDGTCIIVIDLKNAKEILKNDKTVTRFLEMYPDAILEPSGAVDESSPPQSSVSFVSENVTLYVRIIESRYDQCFVPVSYKIVPHNDAFSYYVPSGIISNLYPVMKQYQAGFDITNLVCPEDLFLIQKHDGTPACVKYETFEKLTGRGWFAPIFFGSSGEEVK